MRIRNIRVLPIEIPLKKPFATSRRVQRVGRFIVVELETGDGLVGYGEVDPRPHITGEVLESALVVLERVLVPSLRGAELENVRPLHRTMDRVVEQNPAAKAGIDMAVYDALGKEFGAPVSELLGGRLRDEIRINAWCGIGDLEEVRKTLIRKKRDGFSYSVKLKVGVDPERDLAAIRVAREVFGGEVDIIADANQAWDLGTAMKFLRKLDNGELSVVEQPLPSQDLAGMARLTSLLKMRVMADESVWNLRDIYVVSRLGAADMVNVKLCKSGGLWEAWRMLEVAGREGLECMVGSTVETSISAAAEAHLAASSPCVRYVDIMLPEDNLVEDIATGLESEGDRIRVPRRAGLGVAVDEKRLEKYLKVNIRKDSRHYR